MEGLNENPYNRCIFYAKITRAMTVIAGGLGSRMGEVPLTQIPGIKPRKQPKQQGVLPGEHARLERTNIFGNLLETSLDPDSAIIPEKSDDEFDFAYGLISDSINLSEFLTQQLNGLGNSISTNFNRMTRHFSEGSVGGYLSKNTFGAAAVKLFGVVHADSLDLLQKIYWNTPEAVTDLRKQVWEAYCNGRETCVANMQFGAWVAAGNMFPTEYRKDNLGEISPIRHTRGQELAAVISSAIALEAELREEKSLKGADNSKKKNRAEELHRVFTHHRSVGELYDETVLGDNINSQYSPPQFITMTIKGVDMKIALPEDSYQGVGKRKSEEENNRTWEIFANKLDNLFDIFTQHTPGLEGDQGILPLLSHLPHEHNHHFLELLRSVENSPNIRNFDDINNSLMHIRVDLDNDDKYQRISTSHNPAMPGKGLSFVYNSKGINFETDHGVIDGMNFRSLVNRLVRGVRERTSQLGDHIDVFDDMRFGEGEIEELYWSIPEGQFAESLNGALVWAHTELAQKSVTTFYIPEIQKSPSPTIIGDTLIEAANKIALQALYINGKLSEIPSTLEPIMFRRKEETGESTGRLAMITTDSYLIEYLSGLGSSLGLDFDRLSPEGEERILDIYATIMAYSRMHSTDINKAATGENSFLQIMEVLGAKYYKPEQRRLDPAVAVEFRKQVALFSRGGGGSVERYVKSKNTSSNLTPFSDELKVGDYVDRVTTCPSDTDEFICTSFSHKQGKLAVTIFQSIDRTGELVHRYEEEFTAALRGIYRVIEKAEQIMLERATMDLWDNADNHGKNIPNIRSVGQLRKLNQDTKAYYIDKLVNQITSRWSGEMVKYTESLRGKLEREISGMGNKRSTEEVFNGGSRGTSVIDTSTIDFNA